jgi:pimeloyl-ACP methyl ester carboxylesterase
LQAREHVAAGGARVLVREWGPEDARPLLYWPGLGATAAYARPAAPALVAAGFRVLAVDPPGFGRSPPLPSFADYAVPSLARLAAAVLDELAGGTCVFVGHSAGASVGAELASTEPRRVEALVLVDGGYVEREQLGEMAGVAPDADDDALVAAASAGGERFATWEEALAFVRGLFLGWPDGAEAAARELFVERDGAVVEAGDPRAEAAVLAGLLRSDPPAWARRLAETRVPTLLLAASGHPAKPAAAEAFAAAGAPAVDLRHVPQWRHHLVQQDPEGFVRIVLGWLAAG